MTRLVLATDIRAPVDRCFALSCDIDLHRRSMGAWRHEHRFEQQPTGTRMVDIAHYQLPFGPLGRVADLLFVRRYLRRLLEARNQHIKLEAEHPRTAGEPLR